MGLVRFGACLHVLFGVSCVLVGQRGCAVRGVSRELVPRGARVTLCVGGVCFNLGIYAV